MAFQDFTSVSPFERYASLLDAFVLTVASLVDDSLSLDASLGEGASVPLGEGARPVAYAATAGALSLSPTAAQYDVQYLPPRGAGRHAGAPPPPAPPPLPASAPPPALARRMELEALFGVQPEDPALCVQAAAHRQLDRLPHAEAAGLVAVMVSACAAHGKHWPCFVARGGGAYVGATAPVPHGSSVASWRFAAAAANASKLPPHAYTIDHAAEVLVARAGMRADSLPPGVRFAGWTRQRLTWAAPPAVRACRHVAVSVHLTLGFDNVDVGAPPPPFAHAHRASVAASVATQPAPARRNAADRTAQIDALAAAAAAAAAAPRGAVSDVWPTVADDLDARAAAESALVEAFAPESEAEAAAVRTAAAAHDALGLRHVAPPGSLLDRAARAAAAAAIGPAGAAGVAAFWRAFLHALRFEHWERREPLPRMQVSDAVAAEGGVDLRCCLVAQKLQMLQRCIVEGGGNDAQVASHELSEARLGEGRRGVREVLALRALRPPHAPLHAPETLPPPPVTEDMLSGGVGADAGTDGGVETMLAVAASAAASKMHRTALQSDMSAFKAANPGCCAEDFIRWHSPRDWIAEGDEAEGGAPPRGRLSERMASPSSEWRRLWDAAPAAAAADQAPLFLPVTQAEKALHYLETADAEEVFAQLLACAISANLHAVVAASAAERAAALGGGSDAPVSASVRALAEASTLLLRRGVEACANVRGLAAAGVDAPTWLGGEGDEGGGSESPLRASFRRCEEAAGIASAVLALLPLDRSGLRAVSMADRMADELTVRLDEARRSEEHTMAREPSANAEGSRFVVSARRLRADALAAAVIAGNEHVVALVHGEEEFFDAEEDEEGAEGEHEPGTVVSGLVTPVGLEAAAPARIGCVRARAYVAMAPGFQRVSFSDTSL